MSSLLEPAVVGGKLELRNRVVMGSMTRNRCIDNKPGQPQVRHYADRDADGTGLIVVEDIFVDWSGCDWSFSPVMITEEHSQAWQQVVNAVHDQGGKIFFQAWHCGRCQHDQMPMKKARNHPVLAASNIKAKAGKYRDLLGAPGHTDNITEINNPSDAIETYRHSAKLAKSSGFDGVELLAQGRANKRTDAYGGTVENRCRFILELVDALSEVFGGPEFVCVKLCPSDNANDSDVTFEEVKEVYTFLLRTLCTPYWYHQSLEARHGDQRDERLFLPTRPSRGFPTTCWIDPVLDFGPLVKFLGSPSLLMANHDYTVDETNQLITEGKLDLIKFGRPFIYNPDVISRIKRGIPFAQNTRGKAVHYGPYSDPNENYNDWPAALTQ